MKIIIHKNKLINLLDKEKKLGFVPTMGAIHAGHISLIKKCKSQCNKTIVSIFVNKPQFNRKIDYKKYPQTLNKDIKILKKNRVDYLFIPFFDEMYPNGINKKIRINKFGKKLCGKSRPGHFSAVADVIDRFIKIINPNKIFLGNKDMQQLLIIRDFVKKNHKKVKLVGCKTIRDINGVALSSRNKLLSKSEMNIASRVYNFLLSFKWNVIVNRKLLNIAKKKILSFGVKKIDYLELINLNKILYPYKKKKKNKIFIAYYLGSTRLIDNI